MRKVEAAVEHVGVVTLPSGGLQVSYVDNSCQSLPPFLGENYGKTGTRLDASNNRLTSLVGLEAFPHLEELILDGNHLGNDLELCPLPYLHTLSLNKNLISDLGTLLPQIASSCPILRHLSLLANQVHPRSGLCAPDNSSHVHDDEEENRRYRIWVVWNIPSLYFLDSLPVSKEERKESQQRGEFLRVVRPTKPERGIKPADASSPFTPLSLEERDPADVRGSLVHCRDRYRGLRSEGNRFIFDKDL
uniref:leucine-rich melanocyte differentiation-associated protein isoform X2 n=1 Tax=Myxine glutinosa TaxID=7769 RepID=UPI00358FAF3B